MPARAATTPARAVRAPLSKLSSGCLALALLLSTALAVTPPTSAPDMALSNVTPGMQGFAITAGPGNALVQFSVSVLSVQNDAGPGFPLVLVRASGAFIDASGGVAAGMSGTPVYLSTPQGPQLLGAIGYVFPSADHHLALVTPIGVMRDATSGAAAGAGPGPVAIAGIGTAVPAATPVLLSGLAPRAAALLTPLFHDPRLSPFPAQASGTLPAGETPPYTLEPGSAISVELARGDVTIGAVGTVTAVDGDKILAFGHPLLGLGKVALPLAPAFVTAIVPSSVVPFKLANSGQKPLATVSQDRPAAISGTLGDGPPMIPVTLTVDAPGGATTYHEQVAADARLYPQLIASAGLQLFDRSLSETTGGYAQIGWEIDLSGGTQLNLVEQVDDPGDIATAAARLLAAPLKTLADNAFEAPGVSAVKANVHLSATQNTAEIVDVVAENPDVKAGTSLVAHVRFQPYRQDPVVKTVTVAIPDSLSGSVTLTFRGGDVKPKGQNSETPAKNRPRSFLELLDAMRQKPQASELVVEAPDAEGHPQRLERLSLPYVVTGSQTLKITVENAKKPSPPAPESSGGGSETASPPPPPAPPPLNQPPSGEPPQPPGGPAPNGDGSSSTSSRAGGPGA
ncbi:MAG TPA: hypothetical protein VKB31_08785 [Trueperaceae bacterium]|nr:hypothetical protein [Trueperaceae bacterium]